MQGKEHFMKNHKGGGAKAVRAMKMAFSTRTTENVWYLDSAAEVHITYDRSDFETFVNEPLPPLRTADNTVLPVLGKGTVLKQVLVNGVISEVRFHDVYLSPGIHYKLISLGTIEAQGFSIELFNGQMKVIDSVTQEVCLTETRDGTSYILDLATPIEKMPSANMYPALGTALQSSHTPPQKHASWTQWHRRLAHLNLRDIKRLVYLSEGIDPIQANALEEKELPHEVCESCCIGKQSRKPSRVPRRQDPVKRAIKPGQGTHADIAGGETIVRTLGGARYVLALTDDVTDMTETHLLKKKSDAFGALKAYTAKMKA